MIRLVRDVALPSVGARRSFACLRQPGFRAYVMALERMSYEAQALGQLSGIAGFVNDVTIVCRGSWIDRRDGERTLVTGQALLGPTAMSLSDAWSEDAQLVTLEWNTPLIGPLRLHDCSPALLDAARRFAAAVLDTEQRALDLPSLRALLEALEREGILVPSVEPMEPPEIVVRAAEQLNWALTHLHEHPMWVDLARGRSERQWRRVVSEHSDWLGLLDGTLRRTLLTIRMQYAASLLTVRGASATDVAHALGYSSDRALRTAMARAQMDLSFLKNRGSSR
ncbi:MAG: helix-turn-helix transcriptional regulator [Myxococcales bacterium]|nr:helix-turn-helix transcriptional regulator [Myxococcales bacterium]